MKLLSITITVLLAAASLAAAADETSADVGQYWSFDGGLELLTLDSDKATQERVKDSATALGVYANYLNRDWVTTIRGSFIMYSDNGGFSQTVVGTGAVNDGDISSRSSDATAMSLGVATGKRWRFGEEHRGSALLQVGYDKFFQSERSIANCSDCRSEDIDIDAGLFILGGLRHSSDAVSVGLTVSQYLSDEGLSNRISLMIGSTF